MSSYRGRTTVRSISGVVLVSLLASLTLAAWPGTALAARGSCLGTRATKVGTRGADVLKGTSGPDVFAAKGGKDRIVGRGGDDLICAGGGADRIAGGGGSDTIIAEGGNDSVAGNAGSDFIFGGPGNDSINGGADLDAVQGDAGDDVMDGGDGLDIVFHFFNPEPVTVDLGAGTATGAGSDTLIGFESAGGSENGDTLIGNPASQFTFYFPGKGNDTVQGSEGFDAIFYLADGSVTVDLGAGTSSGADGNDTLTDMDGVWGSEFADTLSGGEANDLMVGDLGNDSIFGGGGHDWISGGGGNDALDGGPGERDLVDFSFSPSGVTVDLEAGTASSGEGEDTLTAIEEVWGTIFDDTAMGSAAANSFFMHDGADVVDGRGGDDAIDGGPGIDQIVGGAGTDKCANDPTDVKDATCESGGLPDPHPLADDAVTAARMKFR